MGDNELVGENPVRVLVVDDDASVRAAIADALRGRGYAVKTAADGLQCVELLEHQGPVELLVVDLEMPTMGGVELVQALRGHPRHANARVVVISGAPDLADRAALVNAAAFLHKPFGAAELCSVIERVQADGPRMAS